MHRAATLQFARILRRGLAGKGFEEYPSAVGVSGARRQLQWRHVARKFSAQAGGFELRVRRRRDTSSEVRFGFERRPGLAVASPATGCSGGETCIGADCQKVPTGKRGFADLRIKFFG